MVFCDCAIANVFLPGFCDLQWTAEIICGTPSPSSLPLTPPSSIPVPPSSSPPRYTLVVVARDRAVEPRSSNATVFVTVIDENDNTPVIENIISGSTVQDVLEVSSECSTTHPQV